MIMDILLGAAGLLVLAAILAGRLGRPVDERHGAAPGEGESQFRKLFNTAAVPLCFVDRDGVLVDINERFTQTFGYTHDDVPTLNEWWLRAYPDPAYREWVIATWGEAVRQAAEERKDIRPVEYDVTCKDGTVRTMLISGNTLDENFLATFFDVTERKRVEAERAQYFTLFQTSNDLMVVADPRGTFLKINPACIATLGYSPDELTARPFIDFIHIEDRQRTRDEMARQLQCGSSTNFENRYVCKDGSYRWLSWWASYNRDDGLTYATARDVTERKRVEEQLRRAGVYNRSLIEASLDPLVTIGPDGKITDVNAATVEATGDARDALIGADFSEYFTDPAAAKAGYERAYREGAVRDYALEIRSRDGRVTPVLYNASVYRDESGAVAGLFAAARDITARKKSEEALRKLNDELEGRVQERTAEIRKKSDELKESQMALVNIVEDLNEKTAELEAANEKLQGLDRLKSLFIASMSHELRTPLNSIIGFSSIMLNGWTGPLTTEQQENLGTVLRSGKHLLALINDVIDVSKIEAGKVESAVEEFDVSAVVGEAIQAFTADIHKKGLALDVRADHRLLHADRRRLLQCLLNLVSNAVKYTDKGSITVTAGPAADGRSLGFSIADTGIGMTPEDVQRLFSPFVRIVSPRRSPVPGTGLGLYLTKKLAQEVLGGDILVSSVSGKGSTFTLTVPVMP